MVTKPFLMTVLLAAGALLCMLNLSWRSKLQPVQIPQIDTQAAEQCDYLSGGGTYATQQKWHPLTEANNRELATWLKTKSDWTRCSETVAPNVVFKNMSFNLNVTGKEAVLNYEVAKSGSWRQVCVNLEPSDEQFFEMLKAQRR